MRVFTVPFTPLAFLSSRYVLCSPNDSAAICREGSKSFEDGGTTRDSSLSFHRLILFTPPFTPPGTTREARLDPLSPKVRARCAAAGVRLYAGVLRPGETILAPEGWWHYALSLTPSVTLIVVVGRVDPAEHRSI